MIYQWILRIKKCGHFLVVTSLRMLWIHLCDSLTLRIYSEVFGLRVKYPHYLLIDTHNQQGRSKQKEQNSFQRKKSSGLLVR